MMMPSISCCCSRTKEQELKKVQPGGGLTSTIMRRRGSSTSWWSWSPPASAAASGEETTADKKNSQNVRSSTTGGDLLLLDICSWFLKKDDIDIYIVGKYLVWVLFSYYYIVVAYKIRLLSIMDVGTVIHEFDPYFQYRATEYLHQHGVKKFFQWFDYQSWYPLGRPVGATIYPGVQFTAVGIHKLLEFFTFVLSSLDPSCRPHIYEGGTHADLSTTTTETPVGGGRNYDDNYSTAEESRTCIAPMSLNDVCCFIPAWFGVMASIVAGLIAYECSLDCYNTHRKYELLEYLETKISKLLPRRRRRALNGAIYTKSKEKQDKQTKEICYSASVECAVFSLGTMGLCPASLTRSVGGGFDNEAVAILPMMLTMYFWVRSLRGHDERSHRYGCLAGLMFFYLASCWAGYIFVLNLIALHAFGLVLMGRYTAKLYYSYSLFYIVGILLSMQLPIIGFAPVRNLDQISGLVVFMAFQGIHFCEYRVKTNELQGDEAKKYRLSFMFFTATAALALATFFVPSSYFGPLNHRVKGIFFQHAKIGNPLVDSVAEHRSADKMAYYRYLHFLCIGAPLGFLTVVLYWGDASSFLVIYAISAFFLSRRMIRLIFLMGPIASILSGTAIGRMVSHVLYKICELDADEEERVRKNELFNAASLRKSAAVISSCTNKKKKSVKKKNLQQDDYDPVDAMIKTAAYFSILFVFVFLSSSYQHYCIGVSRQLSDPTIIQLTKTKDGKVVKIDDYREAYWWLRDNTPDDARILAWWDYGYQISAIANRTTIADGNTWNYEHIALLGRVFTSCEEDGYNIARHLADYILVWAGGGADDLAKSSYMAKIANSVYGSICPDNDLDCSDFGFMDDNRSPSGVMSESLIYKLHSHNQKIGVATNPNFFKEVYESKHGKVKIFQILNVDGTSRAWVADPKNKVCDVPGGWLCRGQYPPALQTILSEKINSLNDNTDADNSSANSLDSALNNAKKQNIDDREFTTKPNDAIEMEVDDLLIGKEVTAEAIEELSKYWKDTPYTLVMWKVITEGTIEDLQSWLEMAPLLAFVRSSDGRGPMFWAFEHRKHDMVHILLKCGVGHSDRDAKGLTPVDLLDSQKLD